MATDLAAIAANLVRSVPMEGRRVLWVGAGGGQLVAWARVAREVIAVDGDAAALETLLARAAEAGLSDRITPIHGDFMAVHAKADVVLFEFCLHEMPDPGAALAHAAALAPEIGVIDHAPGSPWAWYVLDDEKVVRSWRAVEARGAYERESFETCHLFDDLDGLIAKVRAAGEEAVARARTLAGAGPISIPLGYAIARLRGDGAASA